MNRHAWNNRTVRYVTCAGLAVVYLLVRLPAPSDAADPDRAAAAQAYGKNRPVLEPQPDGLIVAEAEEFQPTGPGWEAKPWGENYYAATFANSFLSRKAFLGAAEQAESVTATLRVRIPESGRYLALVRYEAAYRFETQFRVQIEQDGKRVFDRLYGARDNLKIWAFRQGLKQEVGWSWGAVENIVWEGHDARVKLAPGVATITLVAEKQPEPAARRNVDLVMLTTDQEEVNRRIEKENYLPLDGLLTQSGDVWLRVQNLGQETLTFQGRNAQGGGNWQQHSPYWVHIRDWKTPTIQVEPGKASDWVEVGGTMDSLNDGQWFWTGNQPYRAEFAVRGPGGQREPLATFSGQGDLTLAADADSRYGRRLRKQDEVLYDLLAFLKQLPVHGRPPRKTMIYASTFTPLEDPKHAAAVGEFKSMFGLLDTRPDSPGGTGYIDVRSIPTPKLLEYCEKLGPQAKNIAVVSLGDEISLPAPRSAAAEEAFQGWLKSRGVPPQDLDPDSDLDSGAGGDWSRIQYNPDPKLKESLPGLFYWSSRYRQHFGIQTIKQRTDILRRQLPNAAIGANYSPHYPQEHMFLGEVFKWVSVFRDDGMTLPWSEDYIWQVPVGTPQMNHINLDLFRAGLRKHPDRKILYYVMPHMPNNTPDQWRRLFYGALAHGMKIVNLFEFRPVHVAYTENHVDDPAMYAMVLRSFRELGLFEDLVQKGRVRDAEAALWFSETGDIWGDSHGSFAAAKRALYTAIRHRQIPLDFVVEQDAQDGTLNRYKVLYLTDAHVSRAASETIKKWVEAGGTLFATAGAGMFDELNQPNQILRDLLGVEQESLDAPESAAITWIKQDLPFAEPIERVVSPAPESPASESPASESPASGSPASGSREHAEQAIPVFSVRSRVRATTSDVLRRFGDQRPALTQRETGKGRAIYCAFLPGLSYYKPAIPRRPVDRGATDDSMIHFLPTNFDPRVGSLIGGPAESLMLPVTCSEPLVETTVIEAPRGTVIPLVNWAGRPLKGLQVTVRIKSAGRRVSLASGGKVATRNDGDDRTFTLDLDAADALIIR